MRDLTIELDREAEAFRAEFRDWLAEHIPAQRPDPRDTDAVFAFHHAWHRTLYAGGWMGISWPREYGGRAASPLEQYVYYEELARSGAPRLLNQPAVALVGPTIMAHGTEDIRARHLPHILSGERIWCQGFSEPDAGSDLAGLRTRARREGDEWVVDGQKIWTTWAPYSDTCAVLCRTDPSEQRHRGLTMVVVDLHQPGVTVRPIVQITGQTEFGEVFFEGARAPVGETIGPEGGGWAAAMTMLEFERSDQSFTDHGRLIVWLREAGALLREAEAAGTLDGPGAAQARQRFADAWMRSQLLRRFNLETARLLARGERVGERGSITKLFWSELHQGIARLGADLAAGGGSLDDEWAERYLASRAASIYSGTSEIQRNIIGERLAGLPRS